jgi:hypothetical protein
MSRKPIAKLENLDRNSDQRFRLSVTSDYMTLDNDGTITVLMSRGDVNNLHIDCSQALLDDDIRIGVVVP